MKSKTKKSKTRSHLCRVPGSFSFFDHLRILEITRAPQSTKTTDMRYLHLFALLTCLPLCSSFAGSGVCGFSGSATRLQLRSCSTVPTIRVARTGLLGATALEYSVKKGEEVKDGHKYTFTVTVDGTMSKDSYAVIMKDFKKNAQFPGFRKGTIPPFMLPKVKQFVILDCLEKTLTEAVKSEGLKLASDERKPTLDDAQTKTLTSSFKESDGFTYTIDCELKPESAADADSAVKALQA